MRFGVPGPDQWRPPPDGKEQERAGLNEALAAVRAGGTRESPNPIGSPGPFPMFENIVEFTTRVPS